MVEMVKNAGPLVIALFFLSILTISFVVERFWVLGVARGKLGHQKFIAQMKSTLERKDISALEALCKQNKGSDSRVVHGLIETYQEHKGEPLFELKERLSDRAGELSAIEGSLLERNLIAMATIGSIATMMGLLGTVVGMIRSFGAIYGRDLRRTSQPAVSPGYCRSAGQYRQRSFRSHYRHYFLQLLP